MGQNLRIRVDTAPVRAMLDKLRSDQIPFARALAINSLAAKVQLAETAALSSVFDKPTPFTLRAFAVQRASKAVPYAVVFAKDIQAAYLAPYEIGGKQFLGSKRALLNPKDIKLNQYGNLPKGKLQSLKGRPDIFIGTVKTKSGPISGVWQRLAPPKAGKSGRNPAKVTGPLKLLIRWGTPQPVEAKLHFGQRAVAVVNTNLQREFEAAMAKAMATAR